MRRHFLLTFLSPIKFKDNQVEKVHYTNIDGEDTHTTNESAVRYLLQNLNGEELEKIFILASKKVRENISVAENISHLQYFKNRLKNFLPDVESCITDETIYKYNEENTGAENLKSVAEMAEKIQNLVPKSGDEIILHADLTGGMRHINMMMLDVIRLLEYSGFTIGKIIYSNLTTKRVEEVKNIYDLFQLISGVEEFTNFGSVKVLKSYYASHAETISPALKKLLDAMENFAESIKLCRYGQFKKSVENLHDAINDFSPDKDNLNDILMARLIGRIKQEYEMLIATRGADDLKILRWCIEKGYLQQALTLYTERVPEYIGENFITQTENNAKDLDQKVDSDSMHRNKYFYLFNVIDCTPSQKNVSKAMKVFLGEIKDNALLQIRKKKFSFDAWFANLNKRLLQLEMIYPAENELRNQLETFQKFQENANILSDLKSAELLPVKKIVDAVFDELQQISEVEQRRKKFLEFVQNKINVDTMKNYFAMPTTYNALEKKYPKAFRLYNLISAKYFALKILSEDRFLSIMEKYFVLKDERNHSNHARNDIGDFETAQELENFMLEGIEEIENVEVQ